MTAPAPPGDTGSAEAMALFAAALAGGRMHHGWLLAGPEGAGKRRFAREAAALLLGTGADRLAVHPDHHALGLEPRNEDEAKKRDQGKPFDQRRNITVDQVRALQQRLTVRPTLGQWRAVVIDPADAMERATANALLKSLEEPPAGTVFLLVAHQPGRLLPTIRSRCRVLRFALGDPAAAIDALHALAPGSEPALRAAALRAAGGSAERAAGLLDLDLGPAFAAMERIAELGDADHRDRHALAALLAGKANRERLAAALDYAPRLAAEAARAAGPARRLAAIDAHDELAALARAAPTANFDVASLVVRVGGLLAGLAASK